MNNIFISQAPCSLTLAQILEAKTVEFSAMTAEELKACFDNLELVDTDLAGVLLILLDKAGLSWTTEPSGNLAIATEYGEVLMLSDSYIFG